MLLIASCIFYMGWRAELIILIVISTLSNWLLARLIYDKPEKKKVFLIISLIINFGLLFVFKYMVFINHSFMWLYDCFGWTYPIKDFDIVLPMGISFYTFQALSYIIDVYRGEVKPQKKLMYFALYISMFPQLIAGPIVRYVDIEEQLEHRFMNLTKFGQGAMYFMRGLAKKVILANTTGAVFEQIAAMHLGSYSVMTAWIGCISYAFQIYFDFSGYSDMAIGLGRMFGFEFKKNFDVPYVSKSITEFWRRWHISLSSWFREYVYIPLGGNHVTISRNIVNLLIVWMLTGMWHGAAWNFIVWGIYYGVVLVLEKYVWGAIVDRWPSVLQHIYALVLVLVGWVFFFSPSLGAALRYLFAMVGGGAGFASKEVFFVILTHWLFYLLAVIGSTTIGSRLLRAILNVSENHTVRTVIMLIVFFGMLAISVAYLIADTYNPFLYFRF